MKAFEHYTDEAIIEKILRGETQLYELLIRRNNPFLYRIGRAYRYTHHDTEDLMQETYISAFRYLSRFEGKSTFKTWITRIMLNHCYQKKQKPAFRNETISDNMDEEKNNLVFQEHTSTERTILNRELGHILENALNHIPQEYRLIFTLRDLNGLSIAETAGVTDLSEANVKVRLNRARGLLRTEIKKMYSPADIYEFNLVYCNRVVKTVMSEIKNKTFVPR